MNIPDFFLVGAPKAGTTAFYHYLQQHPEVYMSPVKEPGFFAFADDPLDYRDADGNPASLCEYTITTPDAYQSLFAAAPDDALTGEATTLYLHSEEAAHRIQHARPNAKILIVLRHPVERAYASFMHCLRDDREPIRDFETALQKEEERIEQNWGFLWRYASQSFYADAVERYLRLFGEEQVRVGMFEAFTDAPIAWIQDLYRFLGCDASFEPDTQTRYNASGVPKNRWIDQFLGQRHPIKEIIKPLFPEALRQRLATRLRNKNLEKPCLSPAVRGRLLDRFREDIRRTEDLTRHDLSHWLSE